LRLTDAGFEISESEPLKLVIKISRFGYTGYEAAKILRDKNIEIEFFDGEYTVFMITPENTDEDFEKLEAALEYIEENS
jgi:arginine/lysine/ornithine decarboxylase